MKKLLIIIPKTLKFNKLTYRKVSAHYTKKWAKDAKRKLKASGKLAQIVFREKSGKRADIWIVYSRNKK